jgi:hypothetical protein
MIHGGAELRRSAADPKRALSMNTIKTLFLVPGVCSICSKAAIHTWRHFHPPVPVAAWR